MMTRMIMKFWSRLGRPERVALVTGVVLAVASVPLPTWMALLVGLGATTVLGYLFPAEYTRVAILVAAPILLVAFLVGMVRGISALMLAVFLGCSLILPVGLARLGASAREGR